MSSAPYRVDPDDPRAPSEAEWAMLSDAERQRVASELPSELPRSEPPEGDAHRIPKEQAIDALSEHFRRLGRRLYLSSELPVFYPRERVFAPDVIAVLDVETHPRERWLVSAEGKGIDLAIEIVVSGDRRKDFELNVERYARLGISEYFVFAPKEGRLLGFRLDETRPAAAYQPIVPQAGRWASQVLALDLAIEHGKIRFFSGSAALEQSAEIIARLGQMVDSATERHEQLVRALEFERERAESEAQRADGATERAEREAQRAESATQRAQSEAQRAQTEAQRAEQFAAKLRELGIDPETLH